MSQIATKRSSFYYDLDNASVLLDMQSQELKVHESLVGSPFSSNLGEHTVEPHLSEA